MRKWIAFLAFLLVPLTAAPVLSFEMQDIAVHGFVSQGYLHAEDNNFLADTEDGSFQFNEAGINFSTNITSQLRVGIQLFARDQGEIGNDEVVIDWAYGDYRWRDWLGVRAGIMRGVLGLYNEIRDFDMLRTSILLPQSVYNEYQRDFFSRIKGVGLYGDISLEKFGVISYQAMVGTGEIDEDGGIALQAESSGFLEFVDSDLGTVYNGGIQWHFPEAGIRFGITGYKTTDNETDIRLTIPLGPNVPPGLPAKDVLDEFYTVVYSVEFIYENLILAVEHMDMKRKSSITGFPRRIETDPEGFYISAAYRFTDWLEMGTYYSVYLGDEDDPDGEELEARGLRDYQAWQKDFALTARFDINPNWLVKLEGHRIDGAALLLPQENPDGYEEDWYLFAAKVTFNF